MRSNIVRNMEPGEDEKHFNAVAVTNKGKKYPYSSERQNARALKRQLKKEAKCGSISSQE